MSTESTSSDTTEPVYPVGGPPAWDPMHPGELLREVLDEGLSLSVSEAARRLQVSRQSLHRILGGSQAVTADMALRLGKLGAGDPELWLTLQARYDLAVARGRLADVLSRIEPAAPDPDRGRWLSEEGRLP